MSCSKNSSDDNLSIVEEDPAGDEKSLRGAGANNEKLLRGAGTQQAAINGAEERAVEQADGIMSAIDFEMDIQKGKIPRAIASS
jgi:hypothetical protein